MKRKGLLIVSIIVLFVMAGTVFAEDSRAIVNVSVFNFGFNPDPVTIQVGDTVEWANTAGFHNVVSQTGPDTFSSGAASSAMWVYSKTFTVAGTYTYICEIHPASMQGTITVLPDVAINEVRIDQAGADDDEYFELIGTPGTLLDGLFYIVIGDGSGGSGVIESVTDLTGQTISADGFFVAAESTMTIGSPELVTTLNFENGDNVTHLLVAGFTGANGDDLDTDDDGVLDVIPWSLVMDGLSLIEEMNPPTGTEFEYGSSLGLPVIGPDGSFVPGHVYRFPDGTGGWNTGEFDPAVGNDTVGSSNMEPLAVSLSGMQADPLNRSVFVIVMGFVLLAVVSRKSTIRQKAG